METKQAAPIQKCKVTHLEANKHFVVNRETSQQLSRTRRDGGYLMSSYKRASVRPRPCYFTKIWKY